jgi:hypothetical protein
VLIDVVGERLAEPVCGETKLLGAVLVRAPGAATVLAGERLHRGPHLARELEAEEVVDGLDHAERIGLEFVLRHVEEALVAKLAPIGHEAAHALDEVLDRVATEAQRVDGARRHRHADRVLDHTAGRRYRDGGVAVRHQEARIRILRHQLCRVEQEHRRLQQPQVGRPPRVQHSQHALVVGERARQIGGPPPAGVGRQRKALLLVVEVQAVDEHVLDRAVDGRDVADVALAHGHRETPRVLELARGIGRRHGIAHLPGSLVAEPGIDAQQVLECGRCGAWQAQDHDRSLDRMRRLGAVLGVPLLDAQPVHQPPDEDLLERGQRVGIPAEIDRRGGQQLVEPVLPAVGAEIRQTGPLAGPLYQLVARRDHGPRTSMLWGIVMHGSAAIGAIPPGLRAAAARV